MLQYEKKYWKSGKKYLAGIDEAGRGPLAGPVAAAAVILPQNVDLPEVTDSKKISEKKRERLFDDIYKKSRGEILMVCIQHLNKFHLGYLLSLCRQFLIPIELV